MWTVLILCLCILVDSHTRVKIQAVWHASSVDGRVFSSSFAISASSNPSGFLLGQIDPEDEVDRNVGMYSPKDRPSNLVPNQDRCENLKRSIVSGHQSPFVTSLP